MFLPALGLKTYNLDGLRCADTAMVGGDDYLEIALGKPLEQLCQYRVAQPAPGDAAVGRFRIRHSGYQHIRASKQVP